MAAFSGDIGSKTSLSDVEMEETEPDPTTSASKLIGRDKSTWTGADLQKTDENPVPAGSVKKER